MAIRRIFVCDRCGFSCEHQGSLEMPMRWSCSTDHTVGKSTYYCPDCTFSNPAPPLADKVEYGVRYHPDDDIDEIAWCKTLKFAVGLANDIGNATVIEARTTYREVE